MMVCSLGNGRMAAMARLLEAGSYSQNIAEEVGNQKFAAQYIQRELRQADEANLLDEKDMHVFGLEPMTDPLHLVRCNACKKPIMANQYANHAALCKSLSYAEEIVSELGGTGNKKPPRKERKKLTAYSATTGGGKERFESVEADDVATSEFHLDEQVQLASSFSMETKRNLSCLDGALTVDVSRVSPGSTDHSTCAMQPPAKRSKLIAGEGLPMSDHLETANGVARSLCICTQKALTCKEFPKGCRSVKTFDYVVGYQNPSDVHECCFPSKDSSEIYLDHTPAVNFSNDVHVNNGLRTQAAPVGIMRSNLRTQASPVGIMRGNYLSKPFPFAGNSDSPFQVFL